VDGSLTTGSGYKSSWQLALGIWQNNPENGRKRSFDRPVTVRLNWGWAFVINKGVTPRVGYVEEKRLLAVGS
jgi:hypothetical protein